MRVLRLLYWTWSGIDFSRQECFDTKRERYLACNTIHACSTQKHNDRSSMYQKSVAEESSDLQQMPTCNFPARPTAVATLESMEADSHVLSGQRLWKCY